MNLPQFTFEPAQPIQAPAPATVLNTTPEGIWLLQALSGIETLPAVLLLRPYVAASGKPAGHSGIPTLREAGVLLDDDSVHPQVAEWLEILGAPDIVLCGMIRRGDQHLRLAVARRGDMHVAASRADDDVTVELMGRVSSVATLVAQIMPLCGPEVAPARFQAITVPSSDLMNGLGQIVQGDHTPVVALRGLGLTAAQQRILVAAADQPIAELTMTLVQYTSCGDFVGEAAVTVTDTADGRLVTGPVLASDGRWWTQISGGTAEAIERALNSLIKSLPVPAWRDHSRHA
jgi:hypothetical protein